MFLQKACVKCEKLCKQSKRIFEVLDIHSVRQKCIEDTKQRERNKRISTMCDKKPRYCDVTDTKDCAH